MRLLIGIDMRNKSFVLYGAIVDYVFIFCKLETLLYDQGLYDKVKSIGTPLEYLPPEVSYFSPDSNG